ncbi:unnamed protein product [Spirodela intermedia]|uniref:Long-chain-alcohol oxidase n=1 Tax=Spirodela intermedia TaxID=51605 RepID=A0A7I8ID31_SPIIN|nr:unnamed protein product [Spirodela intermedia]CAA6655294.1 unnamed protein product [Spirodela intermedia]
MERGWKRECHPLLKGGRRAGEGPSHAAMCEALIPPLEAENLSIPGSREEPPARASKPSTGPPAPIPLSPTRFPADSSSFLSLPSSSLSNSAAFGLSEGTYLMKAVLWALSTRLGTLTLCGLVCLSGEFPFVHRFSELPLRKREKLLQRWSRETFFRPLRLVFLLVKILALYNFFSRLDENLENRAWEAIGTASPKKKGLAEHAERGAGEGSGGDGEGDGLILAQVSVAEGPQGARGSHRGRPQRRVRRGDRRLRLRRRGRRRRPRRLRLEGGRPREGGLLRGGRLLLEGRPVHGEALRGEGILSTLDGKIMILAGATVGGGSAVNWAACIRTPADVMREWAEDHRLSLFRSSDYLSAMDAVWKRIGVTERCAEEGLQNKILRRGCEKLGLKVEFVARNSPEGHFCGSCGYGCPTGEKRGTDTTWLVDAVDHGAVLITGCEAEKFLLEKQKTKTKTQKCVGVAALAVAGEVKRRLRVHAKVSISSGGALRTPLLLAASGLKNRHIGKNLHLHPVIMAWGYFPEAGSDLPGSGGSRVIVETPGLGPGSFATLIPWVSGRDMKERMCRYERTAHLFALARDRGAGAVEGDQRISYKFHAGDREELRRGLRRALRILVAAGAAEVGTHRSDGERIKCRGLKEEELEEFLDGVAPPRGPSSGDKLWSLYASAHQMGSCRMGASEEEGAVDENGESWEAEGMFVCDASLFPTALGVNP